MATAKKIKNAVETTLTYEWACEWVCPNGETVDVTYACSMRELRTLASEDAPFVLGTTDAVGYRVVLVRSKYAGSQLLVRDFARMDEEGFVQSRFPVTGAVIPARYRKQAENPFELTV